eukprot:scaffold62634_cov74-Phaeocystis_antarctica.AAC.1
MFSSDFDLRLRCETVSASSTRPPMSLNGCPRVGAPSLAAKRFRMRATSPLQLFATFLTDESAIRVANEA